MSSAVTRKNKTIIVNKTSLQLGFEKSYFPNLFLLPTMRFACAHMVLKCLFLIFWAAEQIFR